MNKIINNPSYKNSSLLDTSSKKQYSEKIAYDKFYTKDHIALMCINKINLKDYDLVIEPSAGNGSFYNQLIHDNVVALDIMPEHNLFIQKQDWFNYHINPSYKNVLVIGNPPFGKANKLSKKFITHAASFKNVKCIAFILPNVFNKYTLQNIVPKEFRLKEIVSLPQESFELNKKSYHVPSSFFIFEKNCGVAWLTKPEILKAYHEYTMEGLREDLCV